MAGNVGKLFLYTRIVHTIQIELSFERYVKM